jgi:glycosyltransferase involved in cell wall biosynthesis
MRQVRVLGLVSDLCIGGGEHRILNIARAIDRARFDYQVATLYSPDEEMHRRSGDLRGAFEAAGIRVTHLDLPRPRPVFSWKAAQVAHTTALLARTVWRLRSVFAEMGPDVVDAHLQPTVLTAVPAAALANIPVALTLYQAEPLSFVHRALASACIRRATALVSDSRACAEEIAMSSGRGLRDLFVVPNGVRLPPPSQTRRDTFAALGLSPSTETVIAQIAALVPTKGCETLLDAAARFLPDHPRAVLLCIGYSRDQGTQYVDFLKRRAAELGIDRQVRIASWPGSIADIWSIVDIHVHASHYDSLPNAIIEGMSLGRPAVVSSTGGITELVAHDDTGLVVPPRDAAALADAVLRLLTDAGLRDRLGAAAKRRFDERCAPEVTARSIERIFCQIIESRVPPRRAACAHP